MSRLMLPSDVDERIALYLDYRDALSALAEAEARIPSAAPEDLTLISTQMTPDDCDKLTGICISAWPTLRKAALLMAERRVEEIEKKVRAFESGDEI